MKMRSETQALHLVRVMQNHIQNPSYELALSPVMVPKKKLKQLSVNDLLLSGFETLELILIDGDTICANIALQKIDNLYKTEIIDLRQDSIEQSDSKKYKTIKISFGTVQSKVLEAGKMIDISQIDLESVKLVQRNKTIAEGSLVIVDGEIAIQIERVS